MFPPDYFAFIWFQGLSFIRDDVSCDWKDIYLTKNEKIVVPNLHVDIFSFRVFNALLQSYSHRAYSNIDIIIGFAWRQKQNIYFFMPQRAEAHILTRSPFSHFLWYINIKV